MRLRNLQMTDTLSRKQFQCSNETEIHCFLSPSSRYGVHIIRSDVPDFRPLETHFYYYHFIVYDFILDTVTEYTSTCGPLKRFHRFYFLNDTTGILVDFSRNNGSVTQNVIQFSHVNQSVTCEYACVWDFNVDDMLYETDNTRLIASTALMEYNNITHLPLLGEKDHYTDIFARFVPANPFQFYTHFCEKMIKINNEEICQQALQTSDCELLRESRGSIDNRFYPIINGTSLYFIMRIETVESLSRLLLLTLF
ncbi:unnamed protein product [Thelazia callipaeda]|uniref:Uncharacterized protein n=1 Tax=Thelazia callipaeda TaxID=103827 RepID=A0A158RAV5_THECL|nr:unnamed protein product [Thelazia callipaeda]